MTRENTTDAIDVADETAEFDDDTRAGIYTASAVTAPVTSGWKRRHWLRSGDETALQFAKVPLPWVTRIFFTAIVAVIAASFAWQLSGGSVRTITTPSMCPSMCVGQLILDRPATFPLHVGEVVTFQPPGFSVLYTHRVVYVAPNGDFQTKGDAMDHKDPWIATPADVVGQVRYSVWGLGWLNLALPFLAVGMIALLIIRTALNPISKRTWDRLATVLIAVVPIWYLHPLIRGVSLGTLPGPDSHHGIVKGVNTGLLPAQFSATGGQTITHVPSTHTALIEGPFQRDGMVHINQIASLYWWQWVLVLLVVFSPLIGYAYRVFRLRLLDLVIPDDLETDEDEDEDSPDDGGSEGSQRDLVSA